MIPIVSISNSVSFLFCVVAAIKLFLSYRKSREPRIGYFLKFYIFLGVFFGLLSTPGIVVFDPFMIELFSLDFGLFFLYVAVAYFVGIPLELLGYKKAQQISFWSIVGVALLVVFVSLSVRHSAVTHVRPPFIYWQDQRGILVNFLTGIVAAGGAFFSSFFFFLYSLRTSLDYVKKRSLLIAFGMVTLGSAAIANYVFGGTPQIIIASIVAGFMAILGLILILVGIYHSPKDDIAKGERWSEEASLIPAPAESVQQGAESFRQDNRPS